MGKQEQGYVQKPKRTAKDTVFTSLFKEKEYLLQLYQALHPEDIDAKEEDLKIVLWKIVWLVAYIMTWAFSSKKN